MQSSSESSEEEVDEGAPLIWPSLADPAMAAQMLQSAWRSAVPRQEGRTPGMQSSPALPHLQARPVEWREVPVRARGEPSRAPSPQRAPELPHHRIGNVAAQRPLEALRPQFPLRLGIEMEHLESLSPRQAEEEEEEGALLTVPEGAPGYRLEGLGFEQLESPTPLTGRGSGEGDSGKRVGGGREMGEGSHIEGGGYGGGIEGVNVDSVEREVGEGRSGVEAAEDAIRESRGKRPAEEETLRDMKGEGGSAEVPPSPRIPRRPKARGPRAQQRVVITETEQEVAMDEYRWRKYGQKSVKGSPYPRHYYRCTFSKCPCLKHVSRSPENRRVLVAVYRHEHNHPPPSDQPRGVLRGQAGEEGGQGRVQGSAREEEDPK